MYGLTLHKPSDYSFPARAFACPSKSTLDVEASHAIEISDTSVGFPVASVDMVCLWIGAKLVRKTRKPVVEAEGPEKSSTGTNSASHHQSVS